MLYQRALVFDQSGPVIWHGRVPIGSCCVPFENAISTVFLSVFEMSYIGCAKAVCAKNVFASVIARQTNGQNDS